MGNSFKILLVLLGIFVLNGCVGIPDKEGWRYGQKSEFMDILKTDKYLSICNKRGLYEEVKKTQNSVLMSRMLVAYAENLANSCIDLVHFKNIQKDKKSRRIESHYEIYKQEVNVKSIAMKLRAGESIENILSPYVPKNEQFGKLIHFYKAFRNDSNTSQKTLNTIRLNIERVKLMNDKLGHDYALVNIPEFVVRVKKDGKTGLMFRVVVGKKRLQTPVFSERLQYIVLNPQWSVPDSIARNEIIPKLLKNPDYLKKKRMVVRSDYNLKSKVLNPTVEELEAYKGGKGIVPFKFIEVPSKWNGLGRVKFIFPNQHAVYMHDTQSKGLFNRKVRTYSHGCIRLQKPNELLEYITTHYTDETNEQVQKWYDSFKTHHLKLTKHLMVHTVYMTAYVSEDAKLLMFNDIYGYEKSQRLNF